MTDMPDFDLDRLLRPDRVHSDLYTDPALFDAEMVRIFARSWVFVGHEGEIPLSGDFRQRTIARQPVILCAISTGKFGCS